jgi:hypothetical protein
MKGAFLCWPRLGREGFGAAEGTRVTRTGPGRAAAVSSERLSALSGTGSFVEAGSSSLLDQEEDELARGFAPVRAPLGPVDLATLDTLITIGTAASRAEAIGWALARIRERPAYAKLSERARELDELKARF